MSKSILKWKVLGRQVVTLISFLLLFGLSGQSEPIQAQTTTVYKNGTILLDETWTSDNIYIIDGAFTIPADTTLTIEAGTIVAFQYQGSYHDKRYMNVSGTLDLQGTSGDPVVFTSDRDNTYGDINGDGTLTSPAPGDWGYIQFTSSSTNNTFEYAVVRYGGGKYNQYYMLWANSAAPLVQYTTFEYSQNFGIYVYNAPVSMTFGDNIFTQVPRAFDYNGNGGYEDLTVIRNTVTGSTDMGIYVHDVDVVTIQDNNISASAGTGIHVTTSAYATVQNNTVSGTSINGIHAAANFSAVIEDNTATNGTGTGINIENATTSSVSGNTVDDMGYGIKATNTSPTISGNTLSNNIDYPFYQSGNTFPSYSGNILLNNLKHGIAVSGSVNSGTWVNVQGLSWPYILVGAMTVNTNQTLVIPAGTIVAFQYQGSYHDKRYMNVSGTLDLQGTSGDPVVFTSDRDNTYGDINGDGTLTSPAPGDWGYIQFTSSSTNNTFEYAVVRYGGGKYNQYYMLWANSAAPLVQYTTFEYSQNFGIYVYNAPVSMTFGDNIFTQVPRAFDYNGNGGYEDLTVIRNTVTGSTDMGIYVHDVDVVTIQDNNISASAGTGIHVTTSAYATVQNNTVSGTSINGIHAAANFSAVIEDNTATNGTGTGINIENATTSSVSGNTVDDMGYGIKATNTSPTISGNTLSNNIDYPFYQSGNTFPSYSGNILLNNLKHGIAVSGSVNSGTWVNVQGLSWPYILVGAMTVNTNQTLVIPAGTIVAFQYQGSYHDKRYMNVSGTLDLQGTSGDPVVFTSDRDNTYGDINGDGTLTSPAPGDWGYIQFTSSSTNNTFEYAIVRYGGGKYNQYYMLWANSAAPLVQYTTFEYSQNFDLRI